MTRAGRQATPEELAARYAGRWVISRDLKWDGTDGDWAADACAPHKPQRITAATIDQLAEQLQRQAGRGRRG